MTTRDEAIPIIFVKAKMVTPFIFARLIQTYIPTLPHKVESLAAFASFRNTGIRELSTSTELATRLCIEPQHRFDQDF